MALALSPRGPPGDPMTSLLITDIGELVTNDPQWASAGQSAGQSADVARLGLVRNAALVVEAGRVAWIGPASLAPQADSQRSLSGQRGIRIDHLLSACIDEFKENEDLPNTTNPDDWARISGKKGERIIYVRTLVATKSGTEPGRTIDTVSNTGQYL